MKLLIGLLAFLSATTFAQSNPVVSAARDALQGRQSNLVAAAGQMPAGKYGFKPTPAQMSYGELMSHIARSNVFLCSRLSGAESSSPVAGAQDSKEALVRSLQDSFDFCSRALTKVNDGVLGDEVTLFGGRKGTKATALLELVSDWADHYAAAAIYLRLNGLLPPTARKK